ncbi:hypothetical protein SDC9_111878 [bioreactor metagenome]|uniref:Uncharacterized protein n=1 Tax=bioreactor metagenome TaxID=1076179 RepID=A0A645BIH5_9ZZZZ
MKEDGQTVLSACGKSRLERLFPQIGFSPCGIREARLPGRRDAKSWMEISTGYVVTPEFEEEALEEEEPEAVPPSLFTYRTLIVHELCDDSL